MKLKPDKALRDRWFAPEAMSHPAKGHLGLWWELFERYTKAGQWVLDPMAGIGSSMMGAMMGRNVICNEMESHFIIPMKASWVKMRRQAMLGCELGQVVIVQGDARCLPLGRADVVVTSPPYEGSVNSEQNGIDWDKTKRSPGDYIRGTGGTWGNQPFSYTRPAAVITSPPYEGTLVNGETPDEGKAMAREARARERHPERPEWAGYAGGIANIGNLRGAAYWEAMRLVYAECRRVLAPGGVMVLVVKGCVRDRQYVDLPQQTVDECEALGFRLRDRWARELWNLSFWRILQKRRDPAAFDDRLRFEPVLALEKV